MPGILRPISDISLASNSPTPTETQRMKAADARRQPPHPSKRVRPIDTNEYENDVRYHLATRLLDAYDAETVSESVKTVVGKHTNRLSLLQTEYESLHQLRAWTDCFVELQMQWVECGARLESDVALRLWEQLDECMKQVTAQQERTQQLALLQQQLPQLAETATTFVQRAHQTTQSPSILHHSAAAATSTTSATTNATPPITSVRSVPLEPVELTYQWMPRVLHKICAGVETDAAAGRCGQSLVFATRRILSVVRDRNPYAFLSVLYRPPPPPPPSASASASNPSPPPQHQWTLYGSPHVDAIAQLLHHDFDAISELAWWMEKPDATFWKSFQQLMMHVRRVAIAFHHVILQLYAIAMQRHDPFVTANDIGFEIHDQVLRHTSHALQTDGYGLAKSLANADDPILQETYEMFPEVLVYVDQWRHEIAVFEYGFAPKERARDYEVGYHKWRHSTAWHEIAHHARKLVRAWRQSHLGNGVKFQSMAFADLGELEKEIKYRLCEITELLYRQNLAKWSQQRLQPTRARALMELRILGDDSVRGSLAGHSSQGNVAVERSAVHVTEAERKTFFRLPTKTSRRHGGNSRRNNDVDDALLLLPQVDEERILKWTDDEIDAHEQETERVYDLQAGILSSIDSLSLPPLVSGENNTSCDGDLPVREVGYSMDPDMDELACVGGLVASCRRLRQVTRRIVVHGEEIALHGAAEALIQRPSLRIVVAEQDMEEQDGEEDEEEKGDSDGYEDDEDHSVVVDTEYIERLAACPEQLEAALLSSAELFDQVAIEGDCAATPDTRSLVGDVAAFRSVQAMALEALSLLRFAHEQTA